MGRKRKSPKGPAIFEVSDTELSPDASSGDEAPEEPEAKVKKTRGSDVSDSRASAQSNLKIPEKLAGIKKTFLKNDNKQTEKNGKKGQHVIEKKHGTILVEASGSKVTDTPVKVNAKKLKPKKVIKTAKKKSPAEKGKKAQAEKEPEAIDKLQDSFTPSLEVQQLINAVDVSVNTLESEQLQDSETQQPNIIPDLSETTSQTEKLEDCPNPGSDIQEPAVDVLSNTLEDGEVSDSTLDKVDFFKSERSAELSNQPLNTDVPDITISFKSNIISDIYKHKLLKYLESFIELNIEVPDETTMHISIDPCLDPLEWHIVDADSINEVYLSPEKEKPDLKLDLSFCENRVVETTPKKKKNKKNKNKNKELFVLDATPTPEVHSNQNPQYFTRFLINDSVVEQPVDVNKPSSASLCFNCDKNHSLRDCTEPKNMAKINASRQKFLNNKNSKNMGRYHDEDEQKYSHLVPGKISAGLRKALGLKKNQIPRIFYQMRVTGYPPGWLEEAKVEQSDLAMFDIYGNDVKNANLRAIRCLDPNKVIDYPGFNVPLDKEVKDEYHLYRVPPYSKDFCKQNMIDYFEKEFSNKLDDFKTLDMEIEEKSPLDFENVPNLKPNEEAITLTDLEKEKEKLLMRLDNDDSSSRSSDEQKLKGQQQNSDLNKEKTNDENVVDLTQTNEEMDKTTDNDNIVDLTEAKEENNIIDLTEKNTEETKQNEDDKVKCETEIKIVKTIVNTEDRPSGMTTPIRNKTNDSETANTSSCMTTPNTNKIKDSTFGTPILKSASPYNTLPNQDNFSKDISPVINFENLPNSTGKYEQMTGVLQKVRNTLKHLSNCKS